MKQPQKWLLNNKEWVFSGCGVVILTTLVGLGWNLLKKTDSRPGNDVTADNHSTVIQVPGKSGDINIYPIPDNNSGVEEQGEEILEEDSVFLSQINIGIKENSKFLEAVINNTTDENVILTKIIYSRGVSSAEVSLINMCCLYCVQAWHEVQKGPVEVTTSGTQLVEKFWFVRSGAEERKYAGRVHYAPGCSRPLFAQLEMNISVVSAAQEVTKVGILWTEEEEKKGKEDEQNNYTSNLLIAHEDSVCVHVDYEGNGELKSSSICKEEKELGESFL